MIKQVIVIRKDLGMRRGKEIAQCSHASMAFLTRRIDANNLQQTVVLKPQELEWLKSSFTKICVRVNSEQELLDIYEKAKAANLEVHLVIDSGRTEFDGVPTRTCLAIGPDEEEKINPITGDLQLY